MQTADNSSLKKTLQSILTKTTANATVSRCSSLVDNFGIYDRIPCYACYFNDGICKLVDNDFTKEFPELSNVSNIPEYVQSLLPEIVI